MLDILVDEHGAVVTHDRRLGVDIVAFPGVDDPIALFFDVIVNQTYEDKPLYHYIGFIEVPSVGSYDLSVEAAKPLGSLVAPNDSYFLNQWNLGLTSLFEAQWHPAGAKHRVTIGVIDSGISPMLRGHAGLDGVEIQHVPVTVGETVIDANLDVPFSHALGVVSLLADRNHDESGIVSFLGAWNEDSCPATGDPFFAQNAPIIRSYGVGVLGPISTAVAAAIEAAIEDGVDVINLGLAIGNSPLVEDAIQKALDSGIVVVAAAGNYANGGGKKEVVFPASVDGVIAVGAVDSRGKLSKFSARHGVDILAPGDGVIVGGTNDLWYEGYGTSYATPHVTAAAAMLKATNPGLTAADVQEALLRRATGKGNGGLGILNAVGSLNHVLPASERTADIATPVACAAYAYITTSSSDLGLGAGKTGDQPWWELYSYDASGDQDLYAMAYAAVGDVPTTVGIEGNYPNPFNPATAIRFALDHAQDVTLSVFNALGQEVRVLYAGPVDAGQHTASFDGSGLPSGIYFAQLRAESGTFTQKMVLTK